MLNDAAPGSLLVAVDAMAEIGSGTDDQAELPSLKRYFFSDAPDRQLAFFERKTHRHDDFMQVLRGHRFDGCEPFDVIERPGKLTIDFP